MSLHPEHLPLFERPGSGESGPVSAFVAALAKVTARQMLQRRERPDPDALCDALREDHKQNKCR